MFDPGEYLKCFVSNVGLSLQNELSVTKCHIIKAKPHMKYIGDIVNNPSSPTSNWCSSERGAAHGIQQQRFLQHQDGGRDGGLASGQHSPTHRQDQGESLHAVGSH